MYAIVDKFARECEHFNGFYKWIVNTKIPYSGGISVSEFSGQKCQYVQKVQTPYHKAPMM
jgi:hypothetical protein